MIRIIRYTIVVLVLFSCKKENAFDCLKSNGTEITEARTVDSFSVIKVYDKIDLNISKGSEFKVEVKAGKNIIKNVGTRIVNSELIIENNNKCNFVRGYKKHITVNVVVPHLTKIDNEGVGTVWFNGDYSQDTIFVRAENSGDIHLRGAFKEIRTSSHGNGDIYVSGSCNRLFVYSFGTNFTFCENLSVNDYIFIESISIGDCYINAPTNGVLEYNLWRSGNIYYKGQPAVINNFSDGTAKGRLIKE